MQCPYCSSDLVNGFVFAPSSHALYWLPNGQKLDSSIISPKSIKKAGGIVLGEISKVGFFLPKDQKRYIAISAKF